jgi:hypothetical protein
MVTERGRPGTGCCCCCRAFWWPCARWPSLSVICLIVTGRGWTGSLALVPGEVDVALDGEGTDEESSCVGDGEEEEEGEGEENGWGLDACVGAAAREWD